MNLIVLKYLLERLHQLTCPANGWVPIFLHSCQQWVTNASIFANLTGEKSYLIFFSISHFDLYFFIWECGWPYFYDLGHSFSVNKFISFAHFSTGLLFSYFCYLCILSKLVIYYSFWYQVLLREVLYYPKMYNFTHALLWNFIVSFSTYKSLIHLEFTLDRRNEIEIEGFFPSNN